MTTTRQRERPLVDQAGAAGSGLPVVAGVDGSPSALDAVRFAAEEAARRGVGLRLVAAFSMPTTLHASNPALYRGLGGFTGLLLGSVAVAASAKVPSTPADRSALPVVVGVDTSPGNAPAATFAFEAASARGVPLTVAHAWADELPLPQGTGFAEWADIEQDQRAVLTRWLAPWSTRFPGVQTRLVVTPSNPARELVAQSAHSQLLVVDSRGRGGLAGLLLGSVSGRVARHAHCPVAVARDRANTTVPSGAGDAATTAPTRSGA